MGRANQPLASRVAVSAASAPGDVLAAGGLGHAVDLGLGLVHPRFSREDGWIAAFAP